MYTAIVSQKGWIVIPKDLRERYHLKPGTKVSVVDYGGVVSLVPLSGDPVKTMRGFLKGGGSLTEDLLAEHKREKAREEEGAEQWGKA